MLGLYPQGLHFPVLMVVDSRQGAEASGLEVALVINMTSKVIKDPLD